MVGNKFIYVWSIPLSISPTTGLMNVTIVGGNVTHGSKLFTESGTFTVPDGVNTLRVTAIGGGGGGGGGGGNTTLGGGAKGGSGGNGSRWYDIPVFVTPNESISVTIGSGGTAGVRGAGGYQNYGKGQNGYGDMGGYSNNSASGGLKDDGGSGGGGGGVTSFGSYISVSGGAGGSGAYNHGTGANGNSARDYIYQLYWVSTINNYGWGGSSGTKGGNGCLYIVW